MALAATTAAFSPAKDPAATIARLVREARELYDCRLRRAQRLLCDKRFDGLGIAEIAWNCGFSEPSHFTRRFRDRFGSTPSAYRLNIAN